MQLTLEDGRQLDSKLEPGSVGAVGRVGINTVVRVPQGKRLWLGAFEREGGVGSGRRAEVRLFVIQARAVGAEPRMLAGAIGPPPLTQSQYERVQRAFVRENREASDIQ